MSGPGPPISLPATRGPGLSNPFYYPLPVYLPFSGTVDANGNAKITIQPRAAFWVSGKVVPKLSLGSGVWEVNDGGSIPLGFGRGQRAEIGSLVVPPLGTIVLNLTGGVPSAAISGSFQGKQHPDMASLAASYAPLPNITTLETTAVRRKLGNISTGPNTTSPVSTFQLFAETRAIALQAVTPGNLTNVNITGNQSGTVYYNTTPSGTLMEFVFVDFASDTSVLVTITAGVGGTSPSVTFWSETADDFVSTRIQSAVPLTIGGTTNVDVTDRAARLVGVVQEGSSPPLWQAPNQQPKSMNNVIAAAGTAVIIAAVGGQTLRLFGFMATTSGATISIQETDGTEVGSLAAGANLAVNLGGVRFAVGLGLQMVNLGGVNATINGMVSYSQG